jgi:hypothetical protein
MRRPVEDHCDPAWRVHALAQDFELLDVWRFPIRVGGHVPFARVVDFLAETQAAMRDRPGLAASLFQFRTWLGRVFGWDDETRARPIPGSVEKSVRERLPGVGERGDPISTSGFQLVYLTEDEALRELQNATVHALLHLARVPLDPQDPTGVWAPQMGVYVKRRGWLGRFYMALIGPFRHLIVYPTLMRTVAEAWPGYLEAHGLKEG